MKKFATMFGQQIAGITLSLVILGTTLPIVCRAAGQKTLSEAVTVNWIPGVVFVAQPVSAAGVTVTPDLQVLQADGAPRTYLTQPGQAPTPWKLGLPVYQGDRVRISVLVATGGSPLQTLIVRLDNKEQKLPDAAPWTVSIDTAQLSPGVHFVEAWAMTAGPSPFSRDRSSDSTLAFEVAPAHVGDNSTAGPTVDPGAAPIASPTLPPPTPEQLLAYSPVLKGQTPNPLAQVALHLRRTVDTPDTLGPVVSPLRISAPVILSVDRPGHSMATRYWYAIVRGPDIQVVPKSLLEAQTDRLQLFPYEADPKSPNYRRGLHPGTVSLYIWGVDRDNHPGSPVVTTLNIADSKLAD